MPIWAYGEKNEHLPAGCTLCGKLQTLYHILSNNNCKVALELRRYNTRHDQILQIIEEFMKQQVSEDVVVADLAE